MHKKLTAAVVTIGALAIPALAAASGESPFTGPHNIAATAINPKTCKFLHPEVDPATGPTWRELRGYSLYEDARHDAKMACLSNRVQKLETRVVTKATLHYVRVIDESTGATATATCPSGYVVTGGGSPSEVEGSWSPTPSTWTVHRDHLSPATMVVEALCVKVSS